MPPVGGDLVARLVVGEHRRLVSYSRGRQALDIDPESPPSYGLTVRGRELAVNLAEALDKAADLIATAEKDALTDLTKTPRPQGMIRRIPQT